MFFRFPPDARWNPERSVIEFGIGVGEYQGVVRVSRRVFQILLPDMPTPERCVEAYHLHRTRLELIAERKVRRLQLTEDGNVEITGRDLREREVQSHYRRPIIGYRRADLRRAVHLIVGGNCSSVLLTARFCAADPLPTIAEPIQNRGSTADRLLRGHSGSLQRWRAR